MWKDRMFLASEKESLTIRCKVYYMIWGRGIRKIIRSTPIYLTVEHKTSSGIYWARLGTTSVYVLESDIGEILG